ncbi:MAG: FAD-binding protein [Treponema sp.]|nr:FAD-binding protein [Treponema sp.]
MIKEITITLVNPADAENPKEKFICNQLAKKLDCKEKDINGFVLVKKSLDARHGKVKFHLRYQVFTGEDRPESVASQKLEYLPCPENAPRVVIVGSGPAGLFAALKLIQGGIRPIVLERGNPAGQRKRDIAAISTRHEVNPDSNYCFGEGGAGTFSDGKLHTRSNKRGNIQGILQIFHHFGADAQILTDAHPHIGTDKLPSVIQAMTQKIVECGGEVHFACRCTELLLEKTGENPSVVGVKAVPVAEKHATQEQVFHGDAVILATGHSATDVYQLLGSQLPAALEDKTFAMGLRVEHPREIIDNIQFHGAQKKSQLGAAEYRLVTQVQERGVYSFCMCPGGLVVPSASCQEGLVVNGMSPSSRGGKWSNAAIVVEIRPQDFELVIAQLEEKFSDYNITVDAKLASSKNANPGLYLRTLLEILTKTQGRGQQAPAQLLVDFLAEKPSQELPRSSYSPGLVTSRLDSWLPDFIKERLQQAFRDFNRKMAGFVCKEALLIAAETRTSTPLRILRNPETLECVAAENLYPAGEGSGYSGGIVSSAMDGEAVAKAIIKKTSKKQ